MAAAPILFLSQTYREDVRPVLMHRGAGNGLQAAGMQMMGKSGVEKVGRQAGATLRVPGHQAPTRLVPCRECCRQAASCWERGKASGSIWMLKLHRICRLQLQRSIPHCQACEAAKSFSRVWRPANLAQSWYHPHTGGVWACVSYIHNAKEA